MQPWDCTRRRSILARWRQRLGIAWLAMPLCLALSIGLAGCAVTPLDVMQREPHELNLQSRSQDGVSVAVEVLSPLQARERFGVDLDYHDLQAVWIRVRNGSPHGWWLIRNLLDADLYSADEVASLVASDVEAHDRPALRQRLRDESIRVYMAPGMETEGHVFLPRVEGGRYLDVRLVADAWEMAAIDAAPPPKPGRHELRFEFAVRLPDGDFDFESLDPAALYSGHALADLDEAGLRQRLESLPCCAADGAGRPEGDPLNVALIGDAAEVMNALSRSGWSFTHRITARSIGREVMAVLRGLSYPVAPVSNLYAFGRRHDLAFQRARSSIAQRNHMRLWLAPFRYGGRNVWVGQVSRDIGVKLTTQSPTLTTHVIDPQVDLTREYLLHSLFASHVVERFGFVSGSAQAPAEAPRENLTGDPYFSDGMRLVVILSGEPVPLADARNLMWERSAAPVARGQSSSGDRHVAPIGAP